MSSKANNELRFWFELAERLGCTVAELQSRMTAREFTYWMGLWSLRHQEAEEARKEAERAMKRKKNAPPQRGFGVK